MLCSCGADEQFSDLTFQVLLVSKKSGRWTVPGGGLEPDEVAADAAAREVREEAGVRGLLGTCLGIFEVILQRLYWISLELLTNLASIFLTFQTQNNERKHRTVVYVMTVTEELPEWDDSLAIGNFIFEFQFFATLNHCSGVF